MRSSEKVFFENDSGIRLCGIIDRPTEAGRATALFSHCFTCTKDLKAIVKISRKLAENGIAVLRFDFTGLGDSRGNFSDTNFENNCEDVLAAVKKMATEIAPPSILIGHSLGGAAMMTMAAQIVSTKALVTIASPSTTIHLADYLAQTNPDIVEKGKGEVVIGGRTYLLKKQLLDNLRKQDLPSSLGNLQIPHLIFHPSNDDTLPYWHAEKMFELTGGPKSMVTLDDSDHLLVERKDDCDYVARMISSWLSRFI